MKYWVSHISLHILNRFLVWIDRFNIQVSMARPVNWYWSLKKWIMANNHKEKYEFTFEFSNDAAVSVIPALDSVPVLYCTVHWPCTVLHSTLTLYCTEHWHWHWPSTLHFPLQIYCCIFFVVSNNFFVRLVF